MTLLNELTEWTRFLRSLLILPNFYIFCKININVLISEKKAIPRRQPIGGHHVVLTDQEKCPINGNTCSLLLTELQFLPLTDVSEYLPEPTDSWAHDGNCTVTTDHWSPPKLPSRYSDTDPIFTMTRRTQCGHKSIISRTWSMFYSIQLS